MPTYEYACRDCGRHLEVVQSFSDRPLTKCPSCKGALKKVFSPVGIVLKGSGFYKTDSRSSGAKSSASKDKESKDSKSESSSTSSDSSSPSTPAPEKKAEKKSKTSTEKSA